MLDAASSHRWTRCRRCSVGTRNTASRADAQELDTRTVALVDGWNLVGWTGPDTPLAEAFAGIAGEPQAAASDDSFGLTSGTAAGDTVPDVFDALATIEIP